MKKIKPKISVTVNGRDATIIGMKVLKDGGSALDAVEAAVKVIENNEDDWSVGVGGFPNMMGEVELDASIADGKTLKFGAVAGIRKHGNPVSIARKVMEKTPHVMLVGDNADNFAEIEGCSKTCILTEKVKTAYHNLIKGKEINLWPRVPEESPDLARKYGLKLLQVAQDRKGWRNIKCAELQGTCNAIAIDREGNMASAVSTSGLALKIPGRVGDSPVPGAGNYCNNRFGAAGCAGNGELCMRLSSARMAVLYLEQGLTAREASEKTTLDLKKLQDRPGGFQVLVMDTKGNTWCASNIKIPRYFFMEEDDPEPRLLEGSFMELK